MMCTPRRIRPAARQGPHPLALALAASVYGACGVSGSSSDLFLGSPSPGSGGTFVTGGAPSTGGAATAPPGGAPARGGMGGGGAAAGGASGGASSSAGSSGAATGGSSGSGGSALGGSGGANTAGASPTGGGGGLRCEPEPERCDGLDNDCDGSADEGTACAKGCFGARFDAHDYAFCSSSGRTWLDALDFCETQRMMLVQLDSAQENDFVSEQLDSFAPNQAAWLGANDRDDEGRWAWERGRNAADVVFYDQTSGRALDERYEDFDAGEPNNQGDAGEDCGASERQTEGDRSWDDRPCARRLPLLVCERAPD